MQPDSVHKYYVYVVLLALICLLTLLHTIKLVDIPTVKIMKGLRKICKLQTQRDDWVEYARKSGFIVNVTDTDKLYIKDNLMPIATVNSLFTSSINNLANENTRQEYEPSSEILSEKWQDNKNRKKSDIMTNVFQKPEFRTDNDGTPELLLNGGPEKLIENQHGRLQPLRARKYGNEWLMTKDELLFLRAWCIQRDYRVNWDRILGQCKDKTIWRSTKPYWTTTTVTSAKNSYIFNPEIRPSGQFSKFFIQSISEDGTKRTSGGDSWRIHIKGAASVPVTVIDHDNGTYEVFFFLIDPGRYSAEVILDYTLCDGLKEPTVDWFKKGNSQGKYQHPDALPGYEHPYLLEPIDGGINFTVQTTTLSIFEEMYKNGILEKYCPNPSCMMWDGFGRWVQNVWTPYVSENIEKDSQSHRDGFFWIYGDSVSELFYKSVSKRALCTELFAGCEHTYNWAYKLKNNNITLAKMQWDSNDFSIDRVISELDEVFSDPRMNAHSVILINMGLHYVQGINFTTYKRLIDMTIDLITSHKNSPRGYHGKVIWKTTTALFKERYGDPKTGARHAKGLRFLTVPRVQLFNAYATYTMCHSGIDILDVYPLSDSYPAGTGGVSKPWDAVHYKADCFNSVENMLEEYLG